jgi:hypothetical protein
MIHDFKLLQSLLFLTHNNQTKMKKMPTTSRAFAKVEGSKHVFFLLVSSIQQKTVNIIVFSVDELEITHVYQSFQRLSGMVVTSSF